MSTRPSQHTSVYGETNKATDVSEANYSADRIDLLAHRYSTPQLVVEVLHEHQRVLGLRGISTRCRHHGHQTLSVRSEIEPLGVAECGHPDPRLLRHERIAGRSVGHRHKLIVRPVQELAGQALLDGANARRRVANTNLAYFDNPRYNRRIAAANRLPLGPARQRAFAELEAALMRSEAPWAPIWEGSRWLLLSKRVGCVTPHPIYRIDLGAVCLS